MRVIVGMSGGVDSAVSALLLRQQGFDVIGVFMKNWDEEDENGVCTADRDWEDVQAVCSHLRIPCYSVHFAREYMDRVFTQCLLEYQAGRTPNPDVLCNREIKFHSFLHYAQKIGAERIATGHFVRRDMEGHLLKGVDKLKDQSYFLYMLRKETIQKAVFPVGGLTKQQVRSIAREYNIHVSEKKDSTGICFIGERKFKPFLQGFLSSDPGDMVTPEGEVVGRHDGLMFYTIGQRRGLGIGGKGDGRSFFVAGKDLQRNRLIVVQGKDHPLLYSVGAHIEQLTFVDQPAENGGTYGVKTRYRQPDQPARILLKDNQSADVLFEQPQRAITPGQSLVLYSGEICVGGGIIASPIRS